MNLEINLSQHRYEKRPAIVLFYIVIAFLFLGTAFFNYRTVNYYNGQLSALDEKNSALNSELEKGRRIISEKGLSEKDSVLLEKKINYINLLIEKQAFSWTGLIYRLEECTPEVISITEIAPSFAENNIKITGLSRTVDDIAKFVNNLQSSGYFKDVFLLEHSDVEIEKNNLKKFIITSRYLKG